MPSSKFFHGTPVLIGNNTTPGVQMGPELKEHALTILKACKDWGLDFYPTVINLLNYDEISEIAAYGGFPVRYPHWSFGGEYEELQRGYELNNFKIYEMVVNCCDPKSKVLTKRGTIEAESVVEGDIVFGAAGCRTVAKVIRQEESFIKNIRLVNQDRKLKCTKNHKWRVLSEEGPAWKEAKNIVVGDVLIGGDTFKDFQDVSAKIDFNPQNVIENTNLNVRNRLKPIIVSEKVTLEMAELFGIIIGDGSQGVCGRENMVSVTIGKMYNFYRDYVLNLMNKVFGVDSVIESKPNADVVTVCSKMAVAFLDKAGLTAGCTYNTKRIPWSIWASSSEYRAAFLRGLFDTDGYALDCLGLSGKNNDLMADVQLMLSEMGIYSKLQRINNDHNDISVLTIVGRESLFKFRERINFTIPYKSLGLEKLTNTENCAGGGIVVPYIQNKIIEIGSKLGISRTTEPSLGRSLYLMTKSSFGLNALYSFILRAFEAGYMEFTEIYPLLKNPLYVVESVEDGEKTETIDIALWHDDHDLMIEGINSHNTNPCQIYCLNSNTLLDHLTVIAHATGHNDFFKNNIHFSATDTNMLNNMANHGARVKKYATRWGKERVTEFLDYLLRIDTLVDGGKAWVQKVSKDKNIVDSRTYHYPKRLKVDKARMYMEPYINTKEFKKQENTKAKERGIADELGFLLEPVKDILGFLRDNAPMKPWQQDIMSMIYEESLYFHPQRLTKTLNEGWASTCDSVIMAEQGFVGLGQKSHDCGIIEYAKHKMGVLGGKYSMNPYKLGYELLRDVRDRWDKGQFGDEWEECRNSREKEEWDKKLGLGKEKIFEIRKYYDDLTLIHEYFTEDFCRKMEYFEWGKYANGETRINSHDYKNIKYLLMRRHVNGGLPDIRLTEPNYRGRGQLLLQHYADERPLHDPYVREVLCALRYFWKNDVYLATKNPDGEEMIYECHSKSALPTSESVKLISRKEHERQW